MSQPITTMQSSFSAVKNARSDRLPSGEITVAAAPKMHTAMMSGSRSVCAAEANGFCGTMASSVSASVGVAGAVSAAPVRSETPSGSP